MHKKYAKAIFELLKAQNFQSSKELLENLQKLLSKKGKDKLLRKVYRELARLLDKEAKKMPKIYIAKDDERLKKQAIEFAEKEFGANASDLDIVIKDSLVGGFRLQGVGKIYDASYRKYLLDLYKTLIK